MFEEITGHQVLLRDSNGYFKEAGLYSFFGELFAKAGNRYVRLKVNGSTSNPKMHIEHLDTNLPLYQNQLGWLFTTDLPNTRPVNLQCDSNGRQLALTAK